MKLEVTDFFLERLKAKVEQATEEEVTRVIGSLEKIVERRVRRRLGKIMARVETYHKFGMPEIIINVSFKDGEEERSAL